jgi:dynein heavy chain, axonemal
MLDESLIPSVAQVCVKIHKSVEELSQTYLTELGRYNYVTAMSYKALLNNFMRSYQKKLDHLIAQRDIYSNGVRKLVECNKMVDLMKQELEALKPTLIEKTKRTEEIMKAFFIIFLLKLITKLFIFRI